MVQQLRAFYEQLERIERSGGENRKIAIGELQEKIWDEEIADVEMSEFLSNLATDLNFYEPFEPDRTEDLGYYDDLKLDEMVKAAKLELEKKMTT
jgi:hypothetical protein